MHPADRRRTLFIALLFAVLAAFPLVAGPYGLDFVTKTMIFAVLALSLELLVGSSGLVCFGQAAFFGIAAYATVLLSPQDAAPSLLWLLPACVLAAALYALLVGALSLRGKHHFLFLARRHVAGEQNAPRARLHQ